MKKEGSKMFTNPSFAHYAPKATKTTLRCGSATDWYIHDNVEACIDADLNGRPHTEQNIKWAQGWFAEIGWNDAYADFSSDSWNGQIVSGPYPTMQEAYNAAKEIANEENTKIAAKDKSVE